MTKKPKRTIKPKRVPCKNQNGEGSWVDVIPITWAESRVLRENRRVARAAGTDYDFNAENEQNVRERIVGWDWKDDDGEPLPLPGEGGLELLTWDEVNELSAAVYRTPEESKN